MERTLTLDRYVRDSRGAVCDLSTGDDVELRTQSSVRMADSGPLSASVVERGRDENGEEYLAVALASSGGQLRDATVACLCQRISEMLDNLPKSGIVEIALPDDERETARRGAAWCAASEARRAGFVPACLAGLRRMSWPRLLAGRSVVVIEEPHVANRSESLRRTCLVVLALSAIGARVRAVARSTSSVLPAHGLGDEHQHESVAFRSLVPGRADARVADRPALGSASRQRGLNRARRDRMLQEVRGADRRRGDAGGYLRRSADLAALRVENLALASTLSVAREATTWDGWWAPDEPTADDELLLSVVRLACIAAEAFTETLQLSRATDTLVPALWVARALSLVRAEAHARAHLARCERLAGRPVAAIDSVKEDPPPALEAEGALRWARERLWAAVLLEDWHTAVESASRLRNGPPGCEWWSTAAAGDLALSSGLVGDWAARDAWSAVARSSRGWRSMRERMRSQAFARAAARTGEASVGPAVTGRTRTAGPRGATAAVRAEVHQIVMALCAGRAASRTGGDGRHVHWRVPRVNGSKDCTMEELLELVRMCHEAEDDERTLGRVCLMLRDRLGASAVGIWGEAAPQPLVGAGSGRAWPSVIAARARTAGMPLGPEPSRDGIDAAWPVTHAGASIGALACRWVVDREVARERVESLLTAAATACAPLVRMHLDRAVAPCAPDDFGLIGGSRALVDLRAGIQRAAAAPYHVLIEGESGSGKEVVARAVHHASARRQKRFCAINCAALTDELLEAELFGHARGAFTGAIAERAGLFEDASGGTLFLDEVADLSARGQAKVLRVLQDGEIRRLGENFARRVEVRVVAATNKPLRDEAAKGRFREDLRYRLDVLRLSIPPLRERREDVPLLVAHFWREAVARVGSRALLDGATVTALTRYDWPGNVRELQNVIASLAVHAPRRGHIGPGALPEVVHRGARALALTTLDEARRQFEAEYVRTVLARTGGHRAETARVLGVTRQGLAKLITRLGVGA